MAREGLLRNAGEETIHPAVQEERTPKTPKQKWDNFWYYHKWHVIVGSIVLALGLFLLYDMTHVVQPDYQVAVLTERQYGEQELAPLKAKLESYANDLNGDGRTIVQVNSYAIREDMDPNARIAEEVRITTDLTTGISFLFFTDDASFRMRQSQGTLFSYIDGTLPKDGAKDYDKMRVPAAECKGLAGVEMPKDLSVSLRAYQDTQLEKEGKQAENYAAISELFKKIRQG